MEAGETLLIDISHEDDDNVLQGRQGPPRREPCGGESGASRLLSVDPGTRKLGWCTLGAGGPLRGGTRDVVGKPHASIDEILRGLNDAMEDIIRQDPRLSDMVIEDQLYPGGASLEGCIVQGCIMGAASRHGLRVHRMRTQSVRAFWQKRGYRFRQGKGSRAHNKRRGQKIVRREYPSFRASTNHESDAALMGVAFLAGAEGQE